MEKLARSSEGQVPSSRTRIGRRVGRLLLAIGAVLFWGAQTRAVGQTCMTWGRHSPSPRYLHAMAYDSARGVTVLFGGYDWSCYGETWE